MSAPPDAATAQILAASVGGKLWRPARPDPPAPPLYTGRVGARIIRSADDFKIQSYSHQQKIAGTPEVHHPASNLNLVLPIHILTDYSRGSTTFMCQIPAFAKHFRFCRLFSMLDVANLSSRIASRLIFVQNHYDLNLTPADQRRLPLSTVNRSAYAGRRAKIADA